MGEQTYSLFGNTYNFGDLESRVYNNIGDFIDSIPGGNRNKDELTTAVQDMMKGIGEGSIVFENGKFIDKRGRYTNNQHYDKDGSKDKTILKRKDYYGLAANYIYNQMQKVSKKETKAPEVKSLNGTILSRDLALDLFGSENPDLTYFLKSDPYNAETGKRDTIVRAKHVSDYLNNLQSIFDTKYADYSESDRNKLKNWINQAYNEMLKDGFTDSDMYYLSRAFPGINWNKVFYTGEKFSNGEQAQQQQSQEPSLEQQFYSYLSTKPRYTGDLRTFNFQDFNDYSAFDLAYLDKLSERIHRFSDDLLKQSISTIIDNDLNYNYGKVLTGRDDVKISSYQYMNAILKELNNRKIIKKGESGTYYLPWLDTEEGKSYIYDPNGDGLTIREVSSHDIPEIRDKYWNEFNTSRSEVDPFYYDRYSRYFTTSHKQGGVLKAQRGIKFSDTADYYTQAFTPTWEYILKGLQGENANEYANFLNESQTQHHALWKAAGEDWQNTAYQSDAVEEYQNRINTGFNNEFANTPGGYNTYGIKNALDKGAFVIDGTRTSGDNASTNFTPDALYSAQTDWRRLLGREGDFTPEQYSAIKEQAKKAGWDFYLDDNTKYYMLRKAPQLTGGSGTIPVAELNPEIDPQKLKQTVDAAQKARQSEIDLNDKRKRTKTKDEINNSIGQRLIGFGTNILDLGRLIGSIRTNNRVAETLDESIQPVLKDTYERYSPVTGAFSTMQFMNQQAADVRRQAARPFTSDASLQLAGELQANKQANELEQKGFLTDDAEIKRTANEALVRQEDNMARRSAVANENRAAINAANREKAALEATRMQKNWDSINNYISGIVEEGKSNVQQYKQDMTAIRQGLAQDEYNAFVRDLQRMYTEAGYSPTQMLQDTSFQSAIQAGRRYLNNAYYQSLINRRRKVKLPSVKSYDDIINNIKIEPI